MIRYFAQVEYEGTQYHGFQSQRNTKKTVQYHLEEALGKVGNEKIGIVCSGRTDTGVHALNQVIHFDTKSKRSSDSWVKGGNRYLPSDITIKKVLKVNDSFHARFSAKMRIYKYIIFNRLGGPVLQKNRGWHIMKELDLVAMKQGAKKLVGTKDFSTFRASSCRAKSPIKTIKLVKIKSSKNKIEIEFRSQSFLQQQVRSMVGCLKYLGEKKWSLKKFDNVMKSKKRILCAPPAPPEEEAKREPVA